MEYTRIPADCTLQDYRKNYADPAHRKSIKTYAIIAYVLCGINAALAMVNPFVLVDVAIFLTLALLMHLKMSKGCAIGILAYAIFSMIVGLVLSGTPTGWLWLVIGIGAFTTFNKIDKDYEAFKQRGTSYEDSYNDSL